MIEKHEVKQISWCNSTSQLADCLTKAGTSCEKLLCVLCKVILKKIECCVIKRKTKTKQ